MRLRGGRGRGTWGRCRGGGAGTRLPRRGSSESSSCCGRWELTSDVFVMSADGMHVVCCGGDNKCRENRKGLEFHGDYGRGLVCWQRNDEEHKAKERKRTAQSATELDVQVTVFSPSQSRSLTTYAIYHIGMIRRTCPWMPSYGISASCPPTFLSG